MIRPSLLPMKLRHSFKVFGLVIATAIPLAKPELRAEPVAFKLQANDVIALTGGSNIERTRFNGFLQTHLFTAQPDAKIKVRNFGWEGDTVFEQWRDGGAAVARRGNSTRARAGGSSATGDSNLPMSERRR